MAGVPENPPPPESSPTPTLYAVASHQHNMDLSIDRRRSERVVVAHRINQAGPIIVGDALYK